MPIRSGAGTPLGQPAEFDEPDFNVGGETLTPADSHVRLASHENLNGRGSCGAATTSSTAVADARRYGEMGGSFVLQLIHHRILVRLTSS